MHVHGRRILILCIDRDNDVGEKLGIPTPIVGRENVLNVAIQYILRYPDDSDANAMFAAIQLYDNLVASLGRENVEVALVTGSSSEDTMADLKLLSEVDRVLTQFNADAFIVVSDSPTDEAIVPLLQSRRPVISIKRVIVRQSRGFEEFAVLAKHYLAKLFVEPKYRKYALGLPGALFLLCGVWSLVASYLPSTITSYIGSTFLIVFGISALLYAFNVHEDVLRFIRKYELTFFTLIVSALFVVLYPAVYIYALKIDPLELLFRRPTIFDVLSIALAITLLTNVIEVYAKRGIVPLARIVTTVIVSLFPTTILNSAVWFIANKITFMEFTFAIVLYVLLNIITSLLVSRSARRYVLRSSGYSS